jgi:hypothetical protein
VKEVEEDEEEFSRVNDWSVEVEEEERLERRTGSVTPGKFNIQTFLYNFLNILNLNKSYTLIQIMLTVVLRLKLLIIHS